MILYYTGSGTRVIKDDLCSVMSLPNCPPRHTMRHHDPHVLPTYENGASDMDNLDDVSNNESLKNVDLDGF
jgi:hypothetical protein